MSTEHIQVLCLPINVNQYIILITIYWFPTGYIMFQNAFESGDISRHTKSESDGQMLICFKHDVMRGKIKCRYIKKKKKPNEKISLTL